MKKPIFIITLSALMATSSFAKDIALKGSLDEKNPALISEWAGTADDSLLWKGSNGSNPTNSTNVYVGVNVDVTATKIFPSGGGGIHNNANLIFDNGKTITLTANGAIGFNDYNNEKGTASYAMNYIFSTAEGNSATINLTNTGAQNINLACLDNNFTGGESYTTWGKYGRIFSIGKGITINSTGAFNVKGHNAALTVYDSNFIVSGNLNAKSTLDFTDTILTLNESGVINADGAMNITGTSASLAGTINGKVNVGLGGNVTLSSTGVIKTNKLDLNGGTVNINGTVSKADGSATTLGITKGDTILTFTGGNFNINSINLNGGSATLNNDMTVDTLSASAGTTSSLTTAAGKTLTVTGESTLDENTTSTLGGTIDFTNKLTLKGSLTIDSGANISIKNTTMADIFMTTSSANLTIKGNLTILSSATAWHKTSTYLSGNVTVDGGTLYDATTGTNASAIKVTGNFSAKNNATVKTNSNTYLQIDSGTVTTDGSAKIDVGGFMFANGTKNTLTIANGNELVSKSKLFMQGPSSTAASTADINFGTGHYEFGVIDCLRKSNLNLHLNGATVSFAGLRPLDNSSGTEADITIAIYDFVAGSVKIEGITNDMISGDIIKIGNSTTVTQQAKLIGYDTNGNLIVGDWSIDSNGFLFNSGLAVPEPAEWAAIFGAIALGAAIYRRRK